MATKIDEEFSVDTVDRSLARDGITTSKAVEEDGPIYRVMEGSKIPVSKQMGLLWQSRRDQGMQGGRQEAETRWSEAIRYYENDQLKHRVGRDNAAGNMRFANRFNEQWTETENVVFANCSIMLPMLYAKNPTVAITFEKSADESLGKCLERLANKLMSMKSSPGLSLKSKMRRTVLTTLLTNSGIIKINWTAKQDSTDAALSEIANLSEQLQQAKTKKEIKTIEGKLVALEEKVAILGPAGPGVTALLPSRLVVDPVSSDPNFEDATWIMEWDYLPTAYINAVYGKDNNTGQTVSVFEPTHIMHGCKGDGNGIDDMVNNFTLVPDTTEMKASTYGYASQAQLDAASYTKVWYVWDKITRRVYLFSDNYWKWPIWVWDDPLKLPRFFPYFNLHFHESTDSASPKGEVTYYLDQQDAINDIHDETRRGRRWAKRNIFFDKSSISQEDVEAVLEGPDGTAKGVTLKEGQTLDKAIMSITPPSLKFPELFNTDSKFAAINRITGINDAMRGAQFKTNTTNKAVESYTQNVDIRVDERTDLIEDFIGEIMWNVLMLCMMNWNADDVRAIVGDLMAEAWKQVSDPREFDSQVNARVEGGSTAKPTSAAKKEETVKLMQMLGQFANASPAVVVIMLKAAERAFGDIVTITPEEWKMVIDTMMMQFQKAGGGPNGEEQPPEDPNSQPAQSDEQLKAQITQQIQQLPPQAQQALQELVQQGVPPAEALKQIQEQVQSATT